MKKTTFFCTSALVFVAQLLAAQVWLPQNPNFPVPTQGWKITTVNDSVAWTFGFPLGPLAGYNYEWTEKDYSFSRTTDGGNTWTVGNFPHTEPGYFSNIASLSGDLAWIAYNSYADGVKLLKTNDAGQNWSEQSIGMDTWINFAHYFTSALGVAMGDPGNDGEFQIYVTSNGGSYWEKVSTADIPDAQPGEFGYSGDFTVLGNKIWFETSNDRVYYSPNRGNTWTVWERPATAINYAWGVEADDAGYLYLPFNDIPDTVTNIPTFQIFRRHTTEMDWTDITPLDNISGLIGLSSVPGTNTLVANFRKLWQTGPFKSMLSYDHGNTWMTFSTGDRCGFVDFINAQTGYSCELPRTFENPSTQVFKYNGSPLVGLLDPKPLGIEVSISPNPSADFVKIEFTSASPADFWLLLNDAEGRMLEKVELSKTSAVSQVFDVKSLPAGVYSVTVSSEKGMASRKFVKM